MRMCEILAKYLIELVEGAKGNVVSFVVGDVARWAETKVRPTRSVVFKITNMAEALLAAGLLEKIGKKYILKRDSPLWVKAKAGDVEGMCEIVENALFNYSKVVK
nr:DNA-binding protein [Pyrobaculum calidifontis]